MIKLFIKRLRCKLKGHWYSGMPNGIYCVRCDWKDI